MIHHLLAMLAALAPAESAPEVHNDRLEHRGAAYNVAYRPVTLHQTRAVTTITARGQRLEWCRSITRIAVEAEIRAGDGTEPRAQRLPGERRISSQFVGSCEENRARIADVRMRQAPAIAVHVRELADTGRGALLAALTPARAVAAN